MSEKNKDIIKPRNLSGFPDYLPGPALWRNEIIDKIRAVFESFGFQPLETPILEWAEILLGKYGDEGTRQIYRFRDHGDRDIAMRFDHTVPLARVVAQYQNELPRPFKRYCVGPAFRGERAAAGRYRQFTQMDCDIIGVKSTVADAEIACIMVKALEALGIAGYRLRINSREIAVAFCKESLMLTEPEIVQALRVADKLDKIGLENVSKELRCDIDECRKEQMWREYEIEKTDNPNTPPPLELPQPIADRLLELINCGASTNEETLDAMKRIVTDSPDAIKGVEELEECISWLPHFGVPGDAVTVDPSVIRGLDYYTGIVYETYITGHENFGSVIGGGRYDKLIGKYSSQDIPAVGTSIGIDRLMDCLELVGMSGDKNSNTAVLIINFDEKFIPDYLELSEKLRSWGINNEVYPERRHFGDQVKYALAKSIPYAVIIGEDEKTKGIVQLKDLSTKDQVEVAADRLKESLFELLDK
jgi:histidyl-tRNA synthetase